MRLSQKCSNHPILGLAAGIPLLSKGGEMVGYQYYNFLLLFRGGVPLTERLVLSLLVLSFVEGSKQAIVRGEVVRFSETATE